LAPEGSWNKKEVGAKKTIESSNKGKLTAIFCSYLEGGKGGGVIGKKQEA